MNMNTNLEMTPEKVTDHTLPITETIKEAWENVHGFKGAYWVGLLVIILFAVISGLIVVMSNHANPAAVTGEMGQAQFSGIESLIRFLDSMLNYLFYAGITYVGLRRINNLPFKISMVFNGFKSPIFLKILGLFMLMILIELVIFLPFIFIMIMFGTLAAHIANAKLIMILVAVVFLFILIFVITRTSLALPAIVDKGLNPWAAIKLSFHATKGFVCRILWIISIQILIIVISIIPLGIGLIWSLPFATMTYMVIYKKLIGISMQE